MTRHLAIDTYLLVVVMFGRVIIIQTMYFAILPQVQSFDDDLSIH